MIYALEEQWGREDAQTERRAAEILDEFIREYAGQQHAPSGVLTPSMVRDYYRQRGVDVMVTFDVVAGKFLVEPKLKAHIGITMRKVDE